MKKKIVFISILLTGLFIAFNASAQEVKLAFDVFPGSDSSVLHSLTVFNGKLYFIAHSSEADDGWEVVWDTNVWVFDGNNQPKILADIYFSHFTISQRYSWAYYMDFGIFKNRLYFGAHDRSHGLELWSHDGINEPAIVADINTSEWWGDSVPHGFTVFNNKLYFSATTCIAFDGYDEFTSDDELWEYDGINQPVRVSDINPGNVGSKPRDFTVFNGKLYFTAFSDCEVDYESDEIILLDNELWVYDGENPPSEVADINPGNVGSAPSSLTVFNGKLYFYAYNDVGRQLWVYDGIHHPGIVMDVKPFSNGMIVFKNKLFFSASDGIHGEELWVYDGVNSPAMVADICKGNGSSRPSNYAVFRGKLYFCTEDGKHGRELWVYDGNRPPSLVADINRGKNSSSPSGFKGYNGKLYFSADNGKHGKELWELTAKDPDQPPSVSITSPSKGAIVSGMVHVTVDVMDDHGISQVNFYIDGELKHTVNPASFPDESGYTKEPFNVINRIKYKEKNLSFSSRVNTVKDSTFIYEWDTRTYEIGEHPVGVIVYDTSGQKGTARVDVKVKNTFHFHVLRYMEKSWIIKKQYGKLVLDVNEILSKAADKYVIYRKVDGGDYLSIKEIPSFELQTGSFTYFDKYLERDKTYTYKAEALNSLGRIIAVSGEQTI